MKIIDYVRAMAPVTERKDLTGTLHDLQEELVTHTLPLGKELQEVFTGHTFKSKYMAVVGKELRKRVVFQGNGLDVLVASLEQINANIPLLDKEIKRLFSFQFSPSTLTYNRVNLIRYIESIAFYVRYFRKLALRVVAEEALAVGSATPMGWARAEMEWIDKGLAEFVSLYPAMAQPESKLKTTLTSVSGAEVNGETHELALTTHGARGLDPMNLNGFVAPTSNPFFIAGKHLAELKVKRYQAMKEEAQALQLRMQELRELKSDGNVGPKLQQLIRHTEGRIEQLDYKIAKIEEDNRLDD